MSIRRGDKGAEPLERRELWSVAFFCLTIFFTDAAHSSTIPTFPFYSTFSNIGGVISPIILGAISTRWDIRMSFRFTSVLALVGTAKTLLYSRREAPPLDPLKIP
jgi:sugar phosphate permease